MAKKVKKRLKASYRAKTLEAKRRQAEGRKQRWPESSKTGNNDFSIREYQKDIIQFSEIYICSNSKDQSSFITYRKIVSMIRNNPVLDEKCRIYNDYIENIKTGTILRCLSSSYRSSAGLNCLLICIDELASFDTDSLRFFF